MQIATDKRKHDLSPSLSLSAAALKTGEGNSWKEGRKGWEEGDAGKEGACAFRLRCTGFLLIGGEIYWVPVRVTHDLKPHIVGVIKPQEICIRSERYTLLPWREEETGYSIRAEHGC